jgi:glycosyltransferase involved in cell wall biosynthesis
MTSSVCANEGRAELVSVVIPSYNHERFVVECLESVKALDYERLELIFGDDCSSDGTFEVASTWISANAARFERAEAYRQPVNLGIVRHLQFLYEQAQGEFVACTASDDLLIESGIAARVRLLETRKDLDGVFGNVQVIDEQGSRVLRKRYIVPYVARELQSPRLLPLSILIRWGVLGPGLMLRKSAILPGGSLGTLPSDLTGEDRYIYVRLALQNKLGYLDENVAKSRDVANSASRSPHRQKYVLSYMVDSDRRNRSYATGWNRLVLECAILKHKLLFHFPHKQVSAIVHQGWRVPKIILRVVQLFLLADSPRAMIENVRREWGERRSFYADRRRSDFE